MIKFVVTQFDSHCHVSVFHRKGYSHGWAQIGELCVRAEDTDDLRALARKADAQWDGAGLCS
jgi:hypothetical protein